MKVPCRFTECKESWQRILLLYVYNLTMIVYNSTRSFACSKIDRALMALCLTVYDILPAV